MHAFNHELKQAARSIVDQPGHSALVVGVLAAGLACVIYMLIAIASMVMRPLPFSDADKLHDIGFDNGDSRDGQLGPVRTEDLLQLRRHLAGLAEVSGFNNGTVNLSDLDRPERFEGAFVTGNLFHVLGVAPRIGRDFGTADERDGAEPVVMLSHMLWTSRYGADPGVIGRQVRVNSRLSTIVGVMPEDFSYPRREVVWIPGQLSEGIESDSRYTVVVRQASGVPLSAIETAVSAWFASASRSNPDRLRGLRARIEPLSLLAVNRGTRSVLGVMLVSALLVLMIACANAANLMLTHTLARRQELAIRVALGASRRRLIVQLVAQSLVLTLLGASIAVVLARIAAGWTDSAFRSAIDGPPHWIHFELDTNVVLMTFAVAMLAALAAGILPALRAGSSAMAGDLREGTRGSGGGLARVSRALLVGEVALSLTLLIAVGTLVRGIVALNRPDLGINPNGILTARVGLFPSAYPTSAEQVRFFDTVAQRLRGDPAVIEAAAATTLPGLDGGPRQIIADGEEAATDVKLPQVNDAAVDDHFLTTYGIALSEGRFFDSRDTDSSTRVAVVDQRFADKFGKDEGVLGKRFRLDPRRADGPTVTVVGVIPRLWLDRPGDPIRPALLTPMRQEPARFASLAVRVKGDPAAFAPRLTEHLRAVDPDTPAYWVRTYAQALGEASFNERLLARMFAGFGLVALALAGAGLYGVIAFNVGHRTREIGVRRALGAPSNCVLRNVLARTGWQVGIGLTVGLGLGLGLARALDSSMHGAGAANTGGGDPLTVLAALGVLMAAAVVAVIVPARRALRIDPMVALRHE